MPTASPADLATWVICLAAAAWAANQALGVYEKARALGRRDPAAEAVTKAEFSEGVAGLREELALGLAALKREMGEVRDHARDGVHALREKAHAHEVQAAVLQKSLDNGIKYRVEQLEAKFARLEELLRGEGPRPPHGEKS